MYLLAPLRMTPQEKCVSLSTAKKLKDAGFPQDTERHYFPDILARSEKLISKPEDSVPVYEVKATMITDAYTLSSDPREEYRDGIVAAPDMQEISVLLPAGTAICKGLQGWSCKSRWKTPRGHKQFCSGVEVAAWCWLYLKENNLI